MTLGFRSCGTWRAVGKLAAGLGLLLHCSPYGQQLERGQRYYEENHYEQALAIWRELGTHEDSLSDEEQARFAYLRGMTDFRLGFLEEARYWLSLAKASELLLPASLPREWIGRLDVALDDLARQVDASPSLGRDKEVQVIE